MPLMAVTLRSNAWDGGNIWTYYRYVWPYSPRSRNRATERETTGSGKFNPASSPISDDFSRRRSFPLFPRVSFPRGWDITDSKRGKNCIHALLIRAANSRWLEISPHVPCSGTENLEGSDSRDFPFRNRCINLSLEEFWEAFPKALH